MEIDLKTLSLTYEIVRSEDYTWGPYGRIKQPVVDCNVSNEDGLKWLAASKPKAEIDFIAAMKEARGLLRDDVLIERILESVNGMLEFARAEENANHSDR